MKLNEIHAYHDDPAMNSHSEFVQTFLPDLEDILESDWDAGAHNSGTFVFTPPIEPTQKIEFRFIYKPKSASGHKKVNGMYFISAHNITMEVEFPPKDKMNIAALHDDPEVQKKLMSRMEKRQPSFFEVYPEKLEAIIKLMKDNGADAISASDHRSISTNEDAHAALKAVADSTRGGHFGDHFRLDFMFLTEPLLTDETEGS